MADLEASSTHMEGTLKHEYTDEHWSEYSKRYQDRVSRFTAVGCTKLLELANELHSIESSSYVLDLSSGAGRLVAEIVEKHPGVKVLATDNSPGMLQLVENQNLPGVEIRLVDARTPFTSDKEAGHGDTSTLTKSIELGAFSHVLSSFVIQFLPSPDEVLRNMFHAAKQGGLVGLAIWDTHVVPIQSWGRACKHADPNYSVPKAHDPSAWYSCEEMEEAFVRAGCKKEDIRSAQTVARFAGLDAKGFVNFWFNEGNPSAIGMVNDWYQKGNGKTQEVKDEFERIIREEFEDGEKLDMWFDITVGIRR